MKPSEMEAIYSEACRAATNRPVPEPAQLKIWKQTMGGFDAADIRGGLSLWWEDEKFLPMPAELKPLAERARRARLAQSSQVLDYVHWKCPVCWAEVGGFIPPSDREPRTCRSPYRPLGMKPRSLPVNESCGAIMNETERRMAE